MVTQLKTVATEINGVSLIIAKMVGGTLSGEGEESDFNQVTGKVMMIISKASENQYDDDYKTAVKFILSITNIKAFNSWSAIEKSTFQEIQGLLDMLAVTFSGSLGDASQGLIASKGLVVKEADTAVSFEEQEKAAAQQLSVNRENCAGMDKAAKAIETLLDSSTIVCKDKFDDDCDDVTIESKQLMDATIELTKLSSDNIEGSEISTKAASIVSSVSSVTTIPLQQKNILLSLVSTIKNTVLIYISQISVVESNKLKIGGALAFPGATTTVDKVDENDFSLKTQVLEAQLTNLFQINNANDRVLECLTKIEGLPKSEDPTANEALKKNIDEVPAMCSSPEPPVKTVQKTAADVVTACSSLTVQPTAGEVKSISFIKKSLISFKQTFTSQITISSQQLSDITGVSVTASSLAVSVISATGAIGAAEEIDITGGLTVGSIEFFTLRYEIMRSALNSLELVLLKLSSIIDISTDGGSTSTSVTDISLLILKFSAHLSSGAITSDILTLTQSILQAEVTSKPSGAFLILLNSLSLTISSQQTTLLSELVVIKQSLVQVLVSSGQTLADITFTIQNFDDSGEITETKESGGISNPSQDQVTTSLQSLQASKVVFKNILLILQATISFDYFSLNIKPTVEISMNKFMIALSKLTLLMGKNPTDSEIIILGENFLTYKLSSAASSAVITQMKFILSTVQFIVIQATTEIISLQTQLTILNAESAKCNSDSLGDDSVTIGLLGAFDTLFDDVEEALNTASGSSSTSTSIQATDYFDETLKFYFLLSSFDPLKVDPDGELSVFSKKLVSDVEKGVGVASGKIKNVYTSIIQSIDTVSSGIERKNAQLKKCAGIISKYKRLKSNEAAISVMISIFEMLLNGTNFSSLTPSSLCPGLSQLASPPGFQIPPCSSETESDSKKSFDIITSLNSGLLVSLKTSLEDPSIFSLIETISGSFFKYKFEDQTDENKEEITKVSSTLPTYIAEIQDSITELTESAKENGIDLSDIKFDTIRIPPCPPPFLDPLEEMKLITTGLVSNLYSLESSLNAIEVVNEKDKTSDDSSDVGDFITSLNTLTTLLNLFNPCELFLSIIHEMSSLIVFLSLQILKISTTQITRLQTIMITLQQFILNIIVQINIFQGFFLEFTGIAVDLSTLNIMKICSDGTVCSVGGNEVVLGPVLPSELEANLSVIISVFNIILPKIDFILLLILRLINVDLTFIVSTSKFTCDDLFGRLMKFLSLLIKGQFGQELLDAATAVLEVTSIAAKCSTQTISFIQIIFTVLTQLNVNLITTLVIINQQLIQFKGLILVKINLLELSSLTLDQQITAFDASLELNRLNCEGMDKVEQKLQEIFSFCSSEAESSSEVTVLITDLIELTKKASLSIEDSSIATLSSGILETINKLLTAETAISSSQCKEIEILIITIQNTVLTFVSQISILEQKRLLLGGELAFSISLPSVTFEENFSLRAERQKLQLTGLMECGGFTDRSILSISAAKISTPNPSASCTGSEVLKAARRVTAMCSSPVLPLDIVQSSTQELASCSSNLKNPLNLRELSQIQMILLSLDTFRITFTSQITIVQQKITFLLGQSLSPSILGLSFINEFGLSIPAPSLDITGGDTSLVPVNSIELIIDGSTNVVGMELFLVRQWTEYRFAFSTMQIVLKSIQTVLDITCTDCGGVGPGDGTDFFFAIKAYFQKIGQGLFLTDELYILTNDILSFALEVKIKVSNGIALMLQSIVASLRGYQMACLSEFIVIQQKLIQIGKIKKLI